MKEITIQSVDKDGKKVAETKLQIEHGETLFVQYDEDTPIEYIKKFHDIITDAIKGKYEVISLPKGITFNVVKVG